MAVRDPAPPTERERLIAWNLTTRLPRALLCKLAAQRHAASAAGDSETVERLSRSSRAAISALDRDAAARAEDEIRRAHRLGATLVTLADPEYPAAFRMLALPPPAIYVHGRLPDAPRTAVAIVGARRASPCGREVATWFARELARVGVVIVSGFAIGVDAAAHRGALAADHGCTIAALGCGLDFDYPHGHRELGRRIALGGARISEFPIGRAPNRWQFPVRNRLIAVLAQACVVVEAAPRSGSLVTARLALDLGREVLAVPGRITDELALGTNALIADGARPALDPRDVLEAIGLVAGAAREAAPPKSPPPGLGVDALAIWKTARDQPATVEQLAAASGLAIERALTAALELELVGQIRRSVDGRYEVSR